MVQGKVVVITGAGAGIGRAFALVFAATVLGFSFFFLVMFLEWLALHNWHESKRTQASE